MRSIIKYLSEDWVEEMNAKNAQLSKDAEDKKREQEQEKKEWVDKMTEKNKNLMKEKEK
jgi:hypothetical protein